MDSFDQHEVLLAFKHRGRAVQLKASAKGWAQLYLKENPWTYSRRSARVDYEQAALWAGARCRQFDTARLDKRADDVWASP
jgi:hypothetical protein